MMKSLTIGLAAALVFNLPVYAETIDVPAGETRQISGAISGDEIRKTGSGKVVFAAASPSFAGRIFVEGGVAEIAVAGASGTGEIVVYDGAALVVSHASPGQTKTAVEGAVTIAGSGPDGSGVLRFTGSGSGDKLFQKIILSGNAAAAGGRMGAREWDMGGKNLTWKSGQLVFRGSKVSNAGNIDYQSSSSLIFQDATQFDESCRGKTISVNAVNVTLELVGSNPIPFTLAVNETMTILTQAGAGFNYNVWAGTVTIASGKELKLCAVGPTLSLRLTGAITGAGAVKWYRANWGDSGIVYLDSADNTWSGGFSSSGGYVMALAKGSIGKVGTEGIPTISNTGEKRSTVYLNVGKPIAGANVQTTWSAEDVRDLMAGAKVSGKFGSIGFNLQSGASFVYPYDILTGFSMMGGGELTLAGNIPNNKEFRQLGGKIVLDSSSSGQQILRHLILGDTSGQSGVLELKKGKYKVQEDYIRIGAAGRFAMYQTGGELEGTAWVTNAIADGASSYGAYCLEGGVAKIFDPLNVANGAGSRGFFLQKGGSFKKTSQDNRNSAIRLGVKGEAVMHVSGGTNNSYYATSANKTIGFIVGNEAGGTATLTVSGADTLVKTDIFQLGASDSARTNVLNLVDGGKLAASRFYAGAHSVDGVYQPYASEGYLNIVNANGGAFVPTLSDWWNNLGYICPAREPQKVVLFERGLAVDTSSCGGTHMFPLRLTSATGRGFDSISLPVDNAGFAAEKYIGPARVRISDATGWGATAYADFDRASGKLTGIVVTSRGCDYSENPVITVDSADGAKTYPCSFALSENVPGGLIKAGTGTMRLYSTNDYAGVTFVKTGVLQAEHDKAVPAASVCRVGEGATLKFYNGLSQKKLEVKLKALGGSGNVSAESITLSDGIVAVAEDVNSGEGLSVDCPVVFEEGAVVTMEGFNKVDPEVRSATLLVSSVPIEGGISIDRSVLPEPWIVKFSADRCKLRLVKRIGLSITIR